MEAGALVLLPSPLTTSVAWGHLSEQLDAAERPVIVPEVDDDNRAPYAVRYVASASSQITSALAARSAATNHPGSRRSVVLVAHSGAGPLLPQLGQALRAAGCAVGGYVFCDAGLPRNGASRLALLHEENPTMAQNFRQHLEAGGLFPEWTFADLASVVTRSDVRRDLLGGLRPRGLGFFSEEITVPPDWPDAPCGYLHTSQSYQVWARAAASRAWPVRTFGQSHFEALNDPRGLADALNELIASM